MTAIKSETGTWHGPIPHALSANFVEKAKLILKVIRSSKSSAVGVNQLDLAFLELSWGQGLTGFESGDTWLARGDSAQQELVTVVRPRGILSVKTKYILWIDNKIGLKYEV